MKLSVANISERIYLIQGLQVVLDNDLAEFYQTKTKALNQAVRRNSARFPKDFMIRLTQQEHSSILLRSGRVEKVENRGGRRSIPYGFTQEGVAMLSGVLNSERAVEVNILVMRAFVQLRQASEAHLDLVDRFDQFERRCTEKFNDIVDFVRRPTGNLSDQGAGRADLLVSGIGRENDPQTFKKRSYLEVELILSAVAKYYEIPLSDLKSTTRMASVALPRQICMYLIRKYFDFSYKKIGTVLGGKDHTTVLYACKKIQADAEQVAEIREDLDSIQSALKIEGVHLR
jgi:hypothetical protein